MIFKILFPVIASALVSASPAAETVSEKKPILLVLTNHAKLGDTGKTTGFFLSEAAHPWQVFSKAGYDVKLASPTGGFAFVDKKSHDLEDEVNAAFWEKYGRTNKDGSKGTGATAAMADVKPGEYAAVFYAGGHGTMWDFRGIQEIQRVTAEIYEAGGAVGAVCHGPAALIDVKLKDGSALVKGKRIAAFTNEEEEAVGLTRVVPYLLQTELENAGATHVPGEKFKENAIRDGRLATGQNPASATKAAELLVEALSVKE
ncbi:MAG: type 1 glutamine amidotransferase domain-containing protein [Verrucomicrobiaceae bacterium]|nr:MAG: type 1 glutamine amidotransferase domain-containing protein [Verrucomicrobiaceae bacterium]